MLVQNINLATGVAQEQINNVHPLVRHSLEQPVLAVPALKVDIDLGVGDELPDCCHVAIPDGVGEGSGAVVCGKVDVNIRPLEQNSDNVGSKIETALKFITIKTYLSKQALMSAV